MNYTLLLSCLFATTFAARAATITASGNLPSEVQAAINRAASGDIVVVPPGSVVWDSGVFIPASKGVILSGTGVVITRGATSAVLISLSTHPTISSRVTGFSITQATRNVIMTVNGGFANARFRIDHCNFTSSAGSAVLLTVYRSWGLIDNCRFVGDNASEMVHNEAWGPSSTNGWNDDVVAGSLDAVYIEDCTFSKFNLEDAYFWGTSGLQSYYGSRTVVRYNTFNYCQVDQHGTAGAIGARWWEIYENTFIVPIGTGTRNQSNYMDIRAGSGVIFNNRKAGGVNAGAGRIALREEDPGYPALYQIGRGKGQAPDVAYCWDNPAGTPVTLSSNVQEARDFFSNTRRPGYVPAEYPHPLRKPFPPSNLRVTPSEL